MLMLDVGRKPFPLGVLKDYLRILAWYKMNELHLHLSDEAFGGGYTGFRVQCDTFPGLASKDLLLHKKRIARVAGRGAGDAASPSRRRSTCPATRACFTDYWPDLRLEGLSASYLDVTNPQTDRAAEEAARRDDSDFRRAGFPYRHR